MNIVYVSGSPRDGSNTDYILNLMKEKLGGEFLKLSRFNIEPCAACWKCKENEKCIFQDDMALKITPKLMTADVIVVGSPVFFNNVTAQLKCFIDRTWSLRGKLRNKIGAAVVVGRKYGAEGAITAINSFFLKHDMIIANRGISGTGFMKRDIKQDTESINAVKTLCDRIEELFKLVGSSNPFK